MINVLIKTAFMYVAVMISMRTMGKRQIGQLELSELVTITMLSELATVCITDDRVSILHCLSSIALITLIEIGVSYASVKSRRLGRIIDGTPSALIFKGELKRDELKKSRITLGELVSAMRNRGIYKLSDVNYAFLEPNGVISFVPKKGSQQPDISDMGMKVCEDGVEHVIIMDGDESPGALEAVGKNKAWLDATLKKNGIKKISDVFYLGCDDAGNVTFVPK